MEWKTKAELIQKNLDGAIAGEDNELAEELAVKLEEAKAK